MAETFERIKTALQPRALEFKQYAGELSLVVARDQLLAVLTSLKQDHGYDYLVDIGTIDHYTEQGRFEVFYNIFNLTDKTRIRVKCRVEEDNPSVPTAIGVWPSANWHEREAFDMMGIQFEGHPDLRRIFMPEDFAYYPHRKEFPLIGIAGSIELPTNDGPKGYA